MSCNGMGLVPVNAADGNGSTIYTELFSMNIDSSKADIGSRDVFCRMDIVA